jgi:CheY-like chemotaxis protein
VRVDAGQMEQVILNLVVNARDAMPRGGRLLVETRNVELDVEYAQSHMGVTAGSYVLLTVSDTGVGMDQATAAQVFEPFFTTKEVGKGTGLGLATVHGIVNQSGGHIWVYSEPSHGATFKIYIPRVPEAADVVTVVREEGSTAQGTEAILLVEDDDSVRRIADRILRGAGYSVQAAASGSEALALLQSLDGPVHLVLSDVVMPGMTTFEFTHRLQELVPGITVLFMSGYTDEVIVRHGLIQPGVHFLEKPFTVATLLRRVRDALQASSAGLRPH